MSNDPFTLDMFGATALTSGLGIGLGISAFGGHDAFTANDAAPDPTPPAPVPAMPIATGPEFPGSIEDMAIRVLSKLVNAREGRQ
jgi:hypothetical protein